MFRKFYHENYDLKFLFQKFCSVNSEKPVSENIQKSLFPKGEIVISKVFRGAGRNGGSAGSKSLILLREKNINYGINCFNRN